MAADTLMVDMLAAARLTRLVTTDSFPPVKRLRELVLRQVDPGNVRSVPGAEPPSLAELVECNWCAGFWISSGVLAARAFLPGWDWISRALATSMVVGLVAGVSEREGDLSDLAKNLDGVGLFLGSAIRGAGGAIAESLREAFEPVTLPEDELSEGEQATVDAFKGATESWQARNRATNEGRD